MPEDEPAPSPVRFGLHHVQLAMPPGGEEEARAFYGRVIGLDEVAKPAALATRGGVWFRAAGGLELHLGVDESFEPARKAHPGILVSDLGALEQRLVTAGHDVELNEDLPGYRRFYVSDCFGNRLEFLEPANSRATEQRPRVSPGATVRGGAASHR